MAILAPDDARLPLLDTLLTHFDALVQQLARFDGLSALKAVAHRSSPMVAVYPGGRARYMRHVDNPDGNGRLLTCLYYLNLGWVEGDGGELRLWREEGDVYTATIPPLLDRCVLFWSDGRVPHEVLPQTQNGWRLASGSITIRIMLQARMMLAASLMGTRQQCARWRLRRRRQRTITTRGGVRRCWRPAKRRREDSNRMWKILTRPR